MNQEKWLMGGSQIELIAVATILYPVQPARGWQQKVDNLWTQEHSWHQLGLPSKTETPQRNQHSKIISNVNTPVSEHKYLILIEFVPWILSLYLRNQSQNKKTHFYAYCSLCITSPMEHAVYKLFVPSIYTLVYVPRTFLSGTHTLNL